MITIFEFLNDEPMENIVTCLNFKADKVIFFGYEEVIQKQRKATESFLKKYCGIRQIEFAALRHNDLPYIIQCMRNEIENEMLKGNQFYFDITGGESLLLVAMGMLAKEYKTPLHMFDIFRQKLIEFDEGADRSISRDVEKQHIEIGIERLVEMHGGKVNSKMQKENKCISDPEYVKDIGAIWEVAKTYWSYWNSFSALLRGFFKPDENLYVCKGARKLARQLSESNNPLKQTDLLEKMLDALGAAGILRKVSHADGVYRFCYKNEMLKTCLWDGGSILEMYTYQMEKQSSDECRIGVHIDWDGVIHEKNGIDVLNEIDVLSIKGGIPTFISCKSGKMDKNHSLYAMYELETVANRFGGKYAKKVLVSAQPMNPVYMERAKEMGIEVKSALL